MQEVANLAMTSSHILDKEEPSEGSDKVARIPGPNNELAKKTITDCPHTDRKYYAKGMCANCYHRRGRTKKAWACPHTRKTHYSKGLCKYCYLSGYYKSRTSKRTTVKGAAPAEPVPEQAMSGQD